ncbi:MAG: DUF1707 domain-containing protein [Candidatus Dormiibacterota bacterium]
MVGPSPSQPVSDAQRDQTIVALREHLVAGRMTLEQFADRVDIALRAEISGDLARAEENLPESGSALAGSHGRPARFTLALVAHVVRRGRLRIRRRSVVLSILSDIDLDLREATIDGSRAAILVLAMLGNVDLYLPEGINVDIGGPTLFGHRRDWGRDVALPDAPTVHVRALGCCGTIDVWRVPPGVRGSYADVVRKVKQQQRDEARLLDAGKD